MKSAVKTIALLFVLVSLFLFTGCSGNSGEPSYNSTAEEAPDEYPTLFSEIFSQPGTHLWYQIRYPEAEDGSSYDFGRSAEIFRIYCFKDGKATVYGTLPLKDADGNAITLETISGMNDEEIIEKAKEWDKTTFDNIPKEKLAEGTVYEAPQESNIKYKVYLDETGNETETELLLLDNFQELEDTDDNSMDTIVAYAYVKYDGPFSMGVDYQDSYGLVYDDMYSGILAETGISLGGKTSTSFVTKDPFDHFDFDQPGDENIEVAD